MVVCRIRKPIGLQYAEHIMSEKGLKGIYRVWFKGGTLLYI